MKGKNTKSAGAAPPWHPDFRDVQALPDVKVIRTSFFINGIPLLLLMVGLVLLISLEFRRYSLNGEIRALEARIEENQAANSAVLALQGRFAREERTLREAIEFREESFALSKFLYALGQVLPDEIRIISLRYLDLTERGQAVGKQMQINGSLAGSPEEATALFSSFLRLLEEHPVLSDGATEFVPGSLVPTPERDLMAFSMRIHYKKEQSGERNGR